MNENQKKKFAELSRLANYQMNVLLPKVTELLIMTPHEKNDKWQRLVISFKDDGETLNVHGQYIEYIEDVSAEPIQLMGKSVDASPKIEDYQPLLHDFTRTKSKRKSKKK